MENKEPDQPAKKALLIQARDAVEDVMEPIAPYLPHPNVISGPIRIASGTIDMVLHATVGPIIGTVGYAVTSGLDWVDGFKARKSNMCTVEGTRLDSNADKLINAAHLIYLMTMHFRCILFDIAAIATIANDLHSARQRGGIMEQTRDGICASLHPSSCTPVEEGVQEELSRITANVQGKVKMIMQCVAIGAMMLAGDNENVRIYASTGLLVSDGIGFIGTLKRQGIDILGKLKSLLHRGSS